MSPLTVVMAITNILITIFYYNDNEYFEKPDNDIYQDEFKQVNGNLHKLALEEKPQISIKT